MIGELNETRASIISLIVNEKEIKKKSPQTHLMIFNIRSSINHIEVLISISSKLEIVIRQICLYFTERNRSTGVSSWVPIFCPCFGISLAFWYLFLLMKDEEHS